jgi:hypothetical protein
MGPKPDEVSTFTRGCGLNLAATAISIAPTAAEADSVRLPTPSQAGMTARGIGFLATLCASLQVLVV